MGNQQAPSPSTHASSSILHPAQPDPHGTNAAAFTQTQDVLDHVISQLSPIIPEKPAITPTAASLRGIIWPLKQPFLYFTVPSTGLSGVSNVITLGAGNIWFQDSYFSSSSPASAFLGLPIVSGMQLPPGSSRCRR